MAGAMRDQGELSESVAIYQKTVSSFYTLGWLTSTIERMLKNRLALALWTQGMFWESAFYNEECLKSKVEIYGWAHPIVFTTCINIGACYENLLQYDEALKFYGWLLEKWRGL